MRFYEIRLMGPMYHSAIYTWYEMAEVEAKKLARNKAKKYHDGFECVVNAVDVASKLTKKDLMELLQSDAPGCQEVTKTPQDLIEKRTEVIRYRGSAKQENEE